MKHVFDFKIIYNYFTVYVLFYLKRFSNVECEGKVIFPYNINTKQFGIKLKRRNMLKTSRDVMFYIGLS